LIFDFIDYEKPKKYSSKKELKSLAIRFAEQRKMQLDIIGKFLLEVDRLKSSGRFSDYDILMTAFDRV
jgi:hypothetical protein